MPALVRAPLPAVTPSLGMKQFLSFPLDSGSLLGLVPGFSTVSLKVIMSFSVVLLVVTHAVCRGLKRGSCEIIVTCWVVQTEMIRTAVLLY